MRKDYDFSEAKRACDVPHLAQMQAEAAGKSRITIRVDNTTIAAFKARAALTGGNYQTLMNEALARFAQGLTISDMVRNTLREELQRGK